MATTSTALPRHQALPALQRRRGWRTALLAWQEARPAVQVVFLLRFLTAVMLGARAHHGVPASVVVGAVAWSCLVSAIYLLNGVSDLTGDRANGSTRPIASGRLDPETAARAVVALAVTGLLLSALLGPAAVVLGACMFTLGWAYSMSRRPLKKHMPGFLFVVVTGGLLTYYAGWRAVGWAPGAELLVFAPAMSLWMGLGGSTKDLSDTEGDRIEGRSTWPVRLGDRTARALMAAGALSVGAAFLLTAIAYAPVLVWPAAVVAAGAVVLAVLLHTRLSIGTRAMRRRPYRAFMITQYVAHLALTTHLAIQL
jgi:4-hydroxybenzoate polyprenyltransferase